MYIYMHVVKSLLVQVHVMSFCTAVTYLIVNAHAENSTIHDSRAQ